MAKQGRRKKRGEPEKRDNGGTEGEREDRVDSGSTSVVAVENENLGPAGLRYASSSRLGDHRSILNGTVVIVAVVVVEARNGNGGVEVWGCRWPTAGDRNRDDRAPGLRDPTRPLRPLRPRDRGPKAQPGRPLSGLERLPGERDPIRPGPGRLSGDSLWIRDPGERGAPRDRPTARRARLGPLHRAEQTRRELLARAPSPAASAAADTAGTLLKHGSHREARPPSEVPDGHHLDVR